MMVYREAELRHEKQRQSRTGGPLHGDIPLRPNNHEKKGDSEIPPLSSPKAGGGRGPKLQVCLRAEGTSKWMELKTAEVMLPNSEVWRWDTKQKERRKMRSWYEMGSQVLFLFYFIFYLSLSLFIHSLHPQINSYLVGTGLSLKP